MSDRVLYLTGTPMENRVEEFRNLVHVLQPRLADQLSSAVGIAGSVAFRTAVAPVYLRRNQVDVLDELPERIESLDWVEPTYEDDDAYAEAVDDGNFMAMRRAAYISAQANGSHPVVDCSAKLGRLLDIVDEAREEGLKVLVFSYFRDVLAIVREVLESAHPGDVFGPLTGSVAPGERQRMVDAFTAHQRPAVLVSQIEAGGTGLNIQAASIVVLCEPQWKPSIEMQAIARAHRMGQVRRVRVHRLLTPHNVDQHMLATLTRKQLVFDEYAAQSQLKELTPDAIDVSDLDEVEKVASQSEQERQIIEAERRRLGFETRESETTGANQGAGESGDEV